MLALFGCAFAVLGYLSYPDMFGQGNQNIWLFAAIVNGGLFFWALFRRR